DSQSTIWPRKLNIQTSMMAINAISTADRSTKRQAGLVKCQQKANRVRGGSTGSAVGNGSSLFSNQPNIQQSPVTAICSGSADAAARSERSIRPSYPPSQDDIGRERSFDGTHRPVACETGPGHPDDAA